MAKQSQIDRVIAGLAAKRADLHAEARRITEMIDTLSDLKGRTKPAKPRKPRTAKSRDEEALPRSDV